MTTRPFSYNKPPSTSSTHRPFTFLLTMLSSFLLCLLLCQLLFWCSCALPAPTNVIVVGGSSGMQSLHILCVHLLTFLDHALTLHPFSRWTTTSQICMFILFRHSIRMCTIIYTLTSFYSPTLEEWGRRQLLQQCNVVAKLY